MLIQQLHQSHVRVGNILPPLLKLIVHQLQQDLTLGVLVSQQQLFVLLAHIVQEVLLSVRHVSLGICVLQVRQAPILLVLNVLKVTTAVIQLQKLHVRLELLVI